MSSSEKVRVELTSSADTSGIDKMADASKKLTGGNKSAADAAYDASQKSKELSGALGKNVEVGSQAVAMMGQLGNVSKGGAEGLTAAARAGIAFVTMLKGVLAGAGPVGIALTALAVTGGAIYGLVKALKDGGESADEFKKRMDTLNEFKAESVSAQLKSITDEADRGKKAIAEESAELDKMSDAKLARDKAKIEAEGDVTTPEDKAKRIRALERAREDERINQTASNLDRIAGTDETTARDMQRELARTRAERDVAMSIKPQAEALKIQEDELRFKWERTQLGTPQSRELGTQLAEVSARRKATEAKVAEAEARLTTLTAAQRKAQEAYQKAQAEADESRARADAFKSQQADLKPITAETRGYEDKKNAAKVPLTQAEQAKRDRSDALAKLTFPDEYRQRIASGANVDIGQLRRIYPGVKWPEAIDQSPSAIASVAPSQSPSSAIIQRGGGALPGDGQPKDERIQIDAKPLGKGLADSAAKLKAEIDKQLAQIATTAAAQSVALTATAAAASNLAAKQAQTDAAVAQLQSQVANLRP